MSTPADTATCANCGAPLRPNATYCRECGDTNMSAALFHRSAPPAAQPSSARPGAGWSATEPGAAGTDQVAAARPSALPSQPARRPRWVLGTFWALFTLLVLFAGIVGPKWLLLVAIASGAYSVYLYRGGRYGWFFF